MNLIKTGCSARFYKIEKSRAGKIPEWAGKTPKWAGKTPKWTGKTQNEREKSITEREKNTNSNKNSKIVKTSRNDWKSPEIDENHPKWSKTKKTAENYWNWLKSQQIIKNWKNSWKWLKSMNIIKHKQQHTHNLLKVTGIIEHLSKYIKHNKNNWILQTYIQISKN